MELLTRLFSHYPSGNDPIKLSGETERGDIIVVMPNNWNWSVKEKNLYHWMILRCPITVAKAETMRVPEPGRRETKPYLRVTPFHLNLGLLRSRGYTDIPTASEARAGWRAREQRPKVKVLITEQDFDDAKTRKPDVPDPFVIG